MVINFIFSKEVDEKRLVHSKSNNTKFITDDNANNIVNELFESLISRHQIVLETSMRGSTVAILCN